MIFTKETAVSQLKEEAIILIDKPLEWTSFDAVNKLKYAISKQLKIKPRKFKIGHAGTLDPLATGLLIMCSGKATKKIQVIQDAPKVYTGTITLGGTTPSFDLETEINESFDTSLITKEQCKKVADSFVGAYEQTPPIYSAVWVNGKRAYELARKGEEVKLKLRTVQIDYFNIDTSRFPEIDFEVKCAKGTYIRTLANDFGKRLNNGAFLSALKRTEIGTYQLKDAWTISDFTEYIRNFETHEGI